MTARLIIFPSVRYSYAQHNNSKIALSNKNRLVTFTEPNYVKLISTMNFIHAIARYPTNVIAEIKRNFFEG